MMDLTMLAVIVVAVWIGFPVVVRVLAAIVGPVKEALVSTASVLAEATRGTIARASKLWMEGRTSVGEAIAFGVGSFYHMAVGVQIVWTDLVLAAATVAGLIGLEFSGNGFHYDLLLGISAVFTALIFFETGANLMKWVRTMPFATVERGRIPTFFLAGVGFCGSLALLAALASYRSLMIAEESDPTTVATWMQYLPQWILIAMSSLFTLSAALAFTTIETLFVTIAGLVCASVGLVLGMLTIAVRVLSLAMELIYKVVETLSAWWGERSLLSEAVSALWTGLVDRLKKLVAIEPKQQAEVIVPKPSAETATVKLSPSATESGEMILVQPRVTDVDPEDRQLVGVAGQRTNGAARYRDERWEYPG